MPYKNIIVNKKAPIAIITFNRPDALNALSHDLIGELARALDDFEADKNIKAIILTGSDKAFAAGADIKEMAKKDYMDAYLEDFITNGWEHITKCRKPIIAAVAGYALGGGCEIALMCDFIIAAENAKFGQPEITIGTLPGAGGSQRLARYIGKSKTMDMCLTARMMDADEAERCGLVSRVFPLDGFLDEVEKIANKIASFSLPVIMMNKESVNMAYETTLQAGLKFERRQFHASFACDDRKEGMTAFVEKRPPLFKNR